VNPLAVRRQLLVAESELKRAQLIREWGAMTAGVRTLAGRAKSLGSIASSAAVLIAGLAAFRESKPVDANVKPAWMKSVLKGAGLISTLWLAFRSRGNDQPDP
jgi:hypothetical protein